VVSCHGDVRDYGDVASVVARHRPEIVFHLAAQALVRRSYREPAETYATNVLGTVHVLEAARQHDCVRAVVNVTSDKCYENREWAWGYREIDPSGGHDPYSSSKGCAELVTSAYQRSYCAPDGHLAIASARAGNVIGGGDWAEDRIVPDLVRAITADRPVVLRRPDAIRPWQHVLDPLHGYLVLGRRLYDEGSHVAEPWNFGPNDSSPLTVLELAERFVDVWGSGEVVVDEDPCSPHEAHYLKLDCSKAQTRLGWRPVLNVNDVLDWTARWYREATTDPRQARHLTEQQIHDFMARAGDTSFALEQRAA